MVLPFPGLILLADPLRSPADPHKARDRDLGTIGPRFRFFVYYFEMCLIHILVHSQNNGLRIIIRVKCIQIQVFESVTRLWLTR